MSVPQYLAPVGIVTISLLVPSSASYSIAGCLTLLEIYWNYFFLLKIYWKFTKSLGNFLV